MTRRGDPSPPGDHRPPGERGSGLAPLLVVAILILATGLRFYRLDAQSLWNDEGNAARIAERSLPQIIEGASRDIHPPGYYVILAGWRALTGDSELALRAFSALAGVLTAAVVYAIGASFFDWRVGGLAALLVALNPFQVYYGQEARMYALLALLSAGSVLLAARVLTLPGKMRAERFNARRAVMLAAGYVLVNAAGLYTHYSFPAVLVAETLVFLVWLARRERKLHGLVVWAGLQIAALLLFSPWVPVAIPQVMGWPKRGAGNVGLMTIITTIACGTTLPREAALGGIGPLLILAGVGLFGPVEGDVIGGGGHPHEHPATHSETDSSTSVRLYLRFGERIGLVVLWGLITPALLAALNSLSEPFLKFLLPSGLALMVLAARGVVMGFELGRPLPGASAVSALLTRLVTVILLVGGLAPAIAGLWHLYFDPAYARDDYRGIAGRIMAEAGPDATVVLDAPNQWEVFTYYYPDGPGVTPLPNLTTGETLARLLAEQERIYAVFWGDAEQDPQRVVESALDANAFTVYTEWYGAVRLVLYAVPGEMATEIAVPSGARFGEAITLEGFALSVERLAPGDVLGVTLFWRTDAPLETRYKVFVHLYAPDGTIIAQHDGEPGGDLAPTTTWRPGETLIDNHGLLLPVDAPAGVYRLMVGLYDFGDNRLPISLDGEVVGDSLPLGDIPVGW